MTNATTDMHQLLRGALSTFWDEQLQIETEGGGLAVAMPLMDSSGWQVVVHLVPLTPTQWLLSDQGATLGMLDDAGKRPESKTVREIVEAQCQVYGFERVGLVLQRAVHYPIEPVDIQVFAEGLVALSHLCPKVKTAPASNTALRLEDRISSYFYHRHWTPKRHHKLAGRIEPEIVVEFYWEGPRPLALQPVGRTRNIRSYMEQWGWRWTDLGRAQPELVKAMIYDPDAQEWDIASKRIAEEVCDIFVPVHEAEEALDAAFAA